MHERVKFIGNKPELFFFRKNKFLYIDYICKYNFIFFIKYVSLFYNGKRKTRWTYLAWLLRLKYCAQKPTCLGDTNVRWSILLGTFGCL